MLYFFHFQQIFSKDRENVFYTEKTNFEREILTNSAEQFIRTAEGTGSAHCSVGPSIFCLFPNCMGVSFVSVKSSPNIRIIFTFFTSFCMEMFSFVTLPAMT